MTEPTRVGISLITGYLGAGKTTVLNRILTSDPGLRAAVIVNDIGEVNVDASLIREGAGEGREVIPLTNGCVCCSLAADLTAQLGELADSGEFDHILIEASGVCEPIPIAYAISALCADGARPGRPVLALDNIVAVVDCARMRDEFSLGAGLMRADLAEDDIEGLLIQQIEFCTTLVLSKTDLVAPEEVRELRALVRALAPEAAIVEAAHGDVPLAELIDTGRFDFERAFRSPAWTEAMERPEEPEVLEYAISTFVYERRRPFDTDAFEAVVSSWPAAVIRTKGTVWLDHDPDASYLFEQAGRQIRLTENGVFAHALAPAARESLLAESPGLAERWDPVTGDRMTQLCLIGRHMDRASLEAALDACLTAWGDGA